jgi:hypothetical protein
MKVGELFKRKCHLVLLLIFTTLSLLIFYKYMYVLHPEVAFMDTLRFLTYFENSERGTASLFSTWSQGEHRGYLPQIFVYLNAKFFKFDVFGATLSSGIVLALTGMLLGLEQYRTLFTKDQQIFSWLPFISIVVFTYFALFSLANWELYSLDVGAVLFGKNLVFILYWIGLDWVLSDSRQQLVLRWVLLLSGPFIVLVLAFGWSYAFVITTTITALVANPANGEVRRFRNYLLIVLFISQIIYVVAGYYLGAGSYAVSGKIASVGNVFISFLFAFSSGFMGAETITSLGIPLWGQLAPPIVLMSTLAWLSLSIVISKFKVPLVAVALVIYALFHIVAVSYARGRFDPRLAMAPRYYMDISLFFIGFFWIAILFVKEGNLKKTTKKIVTMVSIMLALFFLVGQGVTSQNEWVKAPYRHYAFNRMRDITLSGVTSVEEARILQTPNIQVAQRGVNVQRAFGLGPFRYIDCTTPVFISGSFDKEKIGWIGKEAKIVIKNCGGDLKLKVFVPDSFLAKMIWVSINGGQLFQTQLVSGQETGFDVPVQEKNAQYINVTVIVDATTRPSDLQIGSRDMRSLGILISSITSNHY